MLKQLLLGTFIFGIAGHTLAVASDTAILDPSSVAPFKICFTNDGEEWPAGQNSPLSLLKPSQTVPFCLNQDLSVADYKDLTVFEKDVFAAVAMWQSYFSSQNPITINFIINTRSLRCSGTPLRGKVERKSVMLGDNTQGKVQVIYPRALLTFLGNTQQTPDIIVSFHPTEQKGVAIEPFCYDKTPTKGARHCVASGPKDRDITSVMLHELNHGYGISSFRSRNLNDENSYGNFKGNTITAFDYQTNNGNGYQDLFANYADHFAGDQNPIVFTGESTVNYLKSSQLYPALLICNESKGHPGYQQNFVHYCITTSCASPYSQQAKTDLMAGIWCTGSWTGEKRINITDLDLHVLYDIGYAPVLKTTTADPDLRESLFNPED